MQRELVLDWDSTAEVTFTPDAEAEMKRLVGKNTMTIKLSNTSKFCP